METVFRVSVRLTMLQRSAISPCRNLGLVLRHTMTADTLARRAIIERVWIAVVPLTVQIVGPVSLLHKWTAS